MKMNFPLKEAFNKLGPEINSNIQDLFSNKSEKEIFDELTTVAKPLPPVKTKEE